MQALRARAASLQAEFEALPLEADGSIRVPPDLRRAIADLALDVLAGPESRARAGAPEILRILTTRHGPSG
jgi:hypothetical protein